MNQGESSGQSGTLFLWLSVLVLGGMLFAAGVLVGHGMAPSQKECKGSTLDKLDKRDTGLALKDPTEKFTFPTALSDSDKQNKRGPDREDKSKRRLARDNKKPVVDRKKIEEQQKQALSSLSEKSHAKKTGFQRKEDVDKNGVTYAIQVASFQQESQAEELVGKLKNKGLDEVRHVTGEVAGKGKYFRVRIGRFSSTKDAMEYMKKKKLKGLVIQCD